LKITDVAITQVAIPYKEPIRLSFVDEQYFSSVIVQVYTDEGIVGLGETSVATHTDEVTAMLKNIKRLLIGEDVFDVEKHLKLYLGSGGGAIWWLEHAVSAVAAVEIACWDIIGKYLKTPVYKLLGGKYREKIPITAFLGIKKPEEVSKDALKAVEQGIKTLKLKVGRNPEEDIEILKKVRDAVGNDVEIRVDPNQAWTPAFAIRQIRKMERYDPQYIEQPVPRWDLEGLKQVKKAVGVPICACESVLTIYKAMEIIRKEAADIISTDPTRMGGILQMKKLAAIAEAADIPVVTHVSWGTISTSAWLQLCVSCPNIMLANDLLVANGVGRVNADEVTKELFYHEKGYVTPFEKAGLGVTIDEEKLKKYSNLFQELVAKKKKPEFFACPPMF